MFPTTDYDLPQRPLWTSKPLPCMKFIELVPYSDDSDGSDYPNTTTKVGYVAVHTITTVETDDRTGLCLICCSDGSCCRSKETPAEFVSRLAEAGLADVVCISDSEEGEKDEN